MLARDAAVVDLQIGRLDPADRKRERMQGMLMRLGPFAVALQPGNAHDALFHQLGLHVRPVRRNRCRFPGSYQRTIARRSARSCSAHIVSMPAGRS